MGEFGAVVETICSFTGLATEREEVKLVAVGVLTVGADSFNISIHG